MNVQGQSICSLSREQRLSLPLPVKYWRRGANTNVEMVQEIIVNAKIVIIFIVDQLLIVKVNMYTFF